MKKKRQDKNWKLKKKKQDKNWKLKKKKQDKNWKLKQKKQDKNWKMARERKRQEMEINKLGTVKLTAEMAQGMKFSIEGTKDQVEEIASKMNTLAVSQLKHQKAVALHGRGSLK